MDTPIKFLETLGRALLPWLAASSSGAALTAGLPASARQTWESWGAPQEAAACHAELEALARLMDPQIEAVAAGLAETLAADRTPELRHAVRQYLKTVPAVIRRVLRRPAHPSGTTWPSGLVLAGPADLLPFLPAGWPRFQAGDRPVAGTDWELEELLGVGPGTEVWKAHHGGQLSVRPAVLKFFHDPASAKVLRNQAPSLERLLVQGRLPGIVPLRQLFLSGDVPCLEYEFLPGGDLTALLHDWHRRRSGGPSPVQVTRLMRHLAGLLGPLHLLRPPLVHCDLKPSNVLVHRPPGGRPSLHLAEVGCGQVALVRAVRAAMRAEPLPEAEVVRGACTRQYASPQVLRGAEPEPRDDVFSLGVIWYQLLTGDLRTGKPTDPTWTARLDAAGLAPPLIALLASCLADDRDDRPAHAASLAERLAILLDNEPVGELLPTDPTARVVNTLGMKFVPIPAGHFLMGSPITEPERDDDEGPQHEVRLHRPFFLGVYPVTQRQFETVMGYNPSYFTPAKGGGPDHPVERVTWSEAVEFCRRLSDLPAEKAAGRSYRLPTEAEWEYACRAGTTTPFHFGKELSSRLANFNGNYPYGGAPKGVYLDATSRVGSYQPNAWGLFDMHGNVWEWCADYFDDKYYRRSPVDDPPGPASGGPRVVRGGSCCTLGRFCRSAYRFGIIPETRNHDVGFRVVLVVTGFNGQG